MPATGAPIIVPAAICAALGMSTDATPEAVRRETKRLLDTPRDDLLPVEVRGLGALEAAIGLAGRLWTREQFLEALEEKFPKAFAAATASRAKAPLAAYVRVDNAIAQRRAHRYQRPELIALASRDAAAFEAAVSSTAVIGYESASAELAAIVRERVKSASRRTAPVAAAQTATPITREGVRAYNERMRAAADVKASTNFASVQHAVTLEYPELAAEVEVERNGVGREYALRSAASSALAIAVERHTTNGKTWEQAIQLVAAERPELVRTYAAGVELA